MTSFGGGGAFNPFGNRPISRGLEAGMRLVALRDQLRSRKEDRAFRERQLALARMAQENDNRRTNAEIAANDSRIALDNLRMELVKIELEGAPEQQAADLERTKAQTGLAKAQESESIERARGQKFINRLRELDVNVEQFLALGKITASASDLASMMSDKDRNNPEVRKLFGEMVAEAFPRFQGDLDAGIQEILMEEGVPEIGAGIVANQLGNRLKTVMQQDQLEEIQSAARQHTASQGIASGYRNTALNALLNSIVAEGGRRAESREATRQAALGADRDASTLRNLDIAYKQAITREAQSNASIAHQMNEARLLQMQEQTTGYGLQNEASRLALASLPDETQARLEQINLQNEQLRNRNLQDTLEGPRRLDLLDEEINILRDKRVENQLLTVARISELSATHGSASLMGYAETGALGELSDTVMDLGRRGLLPEPEMKLTEIELREVGLRLQMYANYEENFPGLDAQVKQLEDKLADKGKLSKDEENALTINKLRQAGRDVHLGSIQRIKRDATRRAEAKRSRSIPAPTITPTVDSAPAVEAPVGPTRDTRRIAPVTDAQVANLSVIQPETTNAQLDQLKKDLFERDGIVVTVDQLRDRRHILRLHKKNRDKFDALRERAGRTLTGRKLASEIAKLNKREAFEALKIDDVARSWFNQRTQGIPRREIDLLRRSR